MTARKTRYWVIRLMAFYFKQLAPGPDQWPEVDTDDYGEFETIWDEALSAARVQDGEAFAAVRRLCAEMDRPKWRSDHLPRVIDAVKQIRAENLAQGEDGKAPAGSPKGRQQAIDASLGCQRCGGQGITLAYHRLHQGGKTVNVVVGRDRQEVTVRSVVGAWCECQMGRHIMSVHQAMGNDCPRFKDILSLGEWLADDPHCPELPRGYKPTMANWEHVVELVGEWMNGVNIAAWG